MLTGSRSTEVDESQPETQSSGFLGERGEVVYHVSLYDCISDGVWEGLIHHGWSNSTTNHTSVLSGLSHHSSHDRLPSNGRSSPNYGEGNVLTFTVHVVLFRFHMCRRYSIFCLLQICSDFRSTASLANFCSASVNLLNPHISSLTRQLRLCRRHI